MEFRCDANVVLDIEGTGDSTLSSQTGKKLVTNIKPIFTTLHKTKLSTSC